MLSTIITAAITGLGTVLLMWLAQKKAAADKARADSLESAAKGEAQATKDEAALIDERDKPNAGQASSNTDWR